MSRNEVSQLEKDLCFKRSRAEHNLKVMESTLEKDGPNNFLFNSQTGFYIDRQNEYKELCNEDFPDSIKKRYESIKEKARNYTQN
jgi:hypothetical protein